MKVWMRCRSACDERFGGAVDVVGAGARQAADHGALDPLGDLRHRLEVAVGGDREAGLDDVDAHLVEELGDLELLFERHRRAGRLLAVAERGVEDDDAVLVLAGAWVSVLIGNVLLEMGPAIWLRGRLGCQRFRSPECPPAQRAADAQGRLSARVSPRRSAGPGRVHPSPAEAVAERTSRSQAIMPAPKPCARPEPCRSRPANSKLLAKPPPVRQAQFTRRPDSACRPGPEPRQIACGSA